MSHVTYHVTHDPMEPPSLDLVSKWVSALPLCMKIR